MPSGLGDLSQAIDFVTASDPPCGTRFASEHLGKLSLGSLSPILRFVNAPSAQQHELNVSPRYQALSEPPPYSLSPFRDVAATASQAAQPLHSRKAAAIPQPPSSPTPTKTANRGLKNETKPMKAKAFVAKNKTLPLVPPPGAARSRTLDGRDTVASSIQLRPASLAPLPKTSTPSKSRLITSGPKAAENSLLTYDDPGSEAPLQSGGKKVTLPKPMKAQPAIQPKSPRAVKDRNFSLYIRIKDNFPEDEEYLTSLMPRATHNNDPHGIHVFVDASNIFIGFTKEMKASRGIPESVHVTGANVHFDALALLMERRRPIAKRVLVGSNPHQLAFDQAEAIGYECSILDKVEKARQLTERQIHFMNRDEAQRQKRAIASRQPYTPSREYVAAYGSNVHHTYDGKSPLFAPIAKVEQGVDELVHLKMSESIIDYDEPGTMVVATGDANKAEYSDGFLKTIERALKKGWKVELVAWNRSISAAYRKRSFTERWTNQFRIIPLDEYAEDLLDFAAR